MAHYKLIVGGWVTWGGVEERLASSLTSFLEEGEPREPDWEEMSKNVGMARSGGSTIDVDPDANKKYTHLG